MKLSHGIYRGVGILGWTRGALMLNILVVALLVAIIGGLKKPGGDLENKRIEAREAAEQVLVDACNASIRFEHPRAKVGLTRTARELPDGSFLVVVSFSVGKIERQARCVGRGGDLAEFAVERTARVL